MYFILYVLFLFTCFFYIKYENGFDLKRDEWRWKEGEIFDFLITRHK